jgi:glyoxylase-like metal-dependent hydrolase (beta-lactamase superfamily II)
MPSQMLPNKLLMIDDLHLGRPEVVATYVLLGDQPALVDPGPASTLENLEAGLRERGITPESIQAILLTHIHLDHAGASGSLVRRYPHIHVYVHERGAPHLIDPERLLRSAKRIYGDLMDTLWGEFLPVPADRLTMLRGGETIRLGERSLRVFDAPGHATHHVMYIEEAGGAAFVGDVTGIRMPNSQYVRPATPPPDIDLESWWLTLETLERQHPKMLLLTHFGPAYDPHRHIAEVRRRTALWAEAVGEWVQAGVPDEEQVARLRALAEAELDPAMNPTEVERYSYAASVEMSWQGLVRYWRKRLDQ